MLCLFYTYLFLGSVLGHYEVYFTVEIICEPAAPVKVIDVQCVAQVRELTEEFTVHANFRDASFSSTAFTEWIHTATFYFDSEMQICGTYIYKKHFGILNSDNEER